MCLNFSDTYKRYYDLKRKLASTAGSQECSHGDASVDPWGAELNKKEVCAKVQVEKAAADDSLLQSIGKKLLARAMLTDSLVSFIALAIEKLSNSLVIIFSFTVI